MDRSSIAAGSAFKTSIIVAFTFLSAIGILTYVLVDDVRSALQSELDEQLLDEQRLIEEILDDTDNDTSVVQAINDVISLSPKHRSLIGLFDKSGALIAGNLDEVPDFLGWGLITERSQNFPGEVQTHRVHVQIYNEFTTIVGQDMAYIDLALKLILRVIIVVCIATTTVAFGIGYFLSRNTFRKLLNMEDVLARTSRGEVGLSLPVSSSNDQVDRVAKQMNVHLDRLSMLIETVRSAGVAIAHELKTPLTRSSLALQNARAAVDNGEDVAASLAVAMKEHERLAWTFETILQIARIENQSGGFEPVTIDLGELVAETVEDLEPVAQENGQELHIGPSSRQTQLIKADRLMIRQLLINLIQNALTHCPAGTSVKVEIAMREDRVDLSVCDNGPGIPLAEHPHIFNPFVQAGNKANPEGVGLGLTLVKAIAERHGATYSLKDAQPGSCFHIHFQKPVQRAERIG